MPETDAKKLPASLRKALTELGQENKTDNVKLTLKELVKATEVSERTIRYYIQEGVLPAPQGLGPASRYSLEHIERLILVRRFKAALLPLSRIKELFSEFTLDELEVFAEHLHDELATSAVNTIRSKGTDTLNNKLAVRTEIEEPLEVFSPPELSLEQKNTNEYGAEPEAAIDFAGRWNRISLAPGLELHYQENGPQDTKQGRKRLAQLVELAMRLYQE